MTDAIGAKERLDRMDVAMHHRLRRASTPNERMEAHEDYEHLTGKKYGSGHDMALHGEGKPHDQN